MRVLACVLLIVLNEPCVADEPKQRNTTFAEWDSLLHQEASPVSSRSNLDRKSLVIDLGTFLAGKTVKADISFKNFLNEEIEIEGLRTDCGCVSTYIGSGGIAPGEVVPIKVVINPGSAIGASSKGIVLQTRRGSAISISMNYRCLGAFTVEPSVIDVAIFSKQKVADFVVRKSPGVDFPIDGMTQVTLSSDAIFLHGSDYNANTGEIVLSVIARPNPNRVDPRVTIGLANGTKVYELNVQVTDSSRVELLPRFIDIQSGDRFRLLVLGKVVKDREYRLATSNGNGIPCAQKSLNHGVLIEGNVSDIPPNAKSVLVTDGNGSDYEIEVLR